MSELRTAVKLQQAVGQRQFGHFDFDSHKAIGPEPDHSTTVVTGVRNTRNRATASAPARTVDKRTGRIKFSSKSK